MRETHRLVKLFFNTNSSHTLPFQINDKTKPLPAINSPAVKKVFLTGATGYIGNQLLRLLLSTGHEVNVVARRARKCEMLHWPNTRVFIGDLSDKEMLSSAMEGCEYVYHTAGYTKLWASDARLIYETNVKGTYNILMEARKQQVKKIVYTSGAGLFGNSFRQTLTENDPGMIGSSNDYDLSRAMAEKLVMDSGSPGFQTVIVNPTRVFGGAAINYNNPISRILLEVMDGSLCPVPACRNVMANYCFIDDVVQGHLLAMEKGRTGERYILGGENISYRQLYQYVNELTGHKNLLPLPLSVMKMLGFFNMVNFWVYGKEPAFTPATIERFFTNAALSSVKASKELGYTITPFKEALKISVIRLRGNRTE